MNLMRSITFQLFEAYAIKSLLLKRNAVLLERIALSGGRTVWYYCKSPYDLDVIGERLCPGSVISFYFDDRIKISQFNDLVKNEINNVIKIEKECVFGFLKDDKLEIEMNFIESISEIDRNFINDFKEQVFFYGPFPKRDYDGVDSVTFILPDDDGVFRAHAH